MLQSWLEVARESRRAANDLASNDLHRSAVSRAYYAAFSKVAHELVVIAGLPMPPDREGPSHRRVRPIIETGMPNMQQAKREKLSELVGRLYTLRIDADYKPSIEVEIAEAREAISIMKKIFDAF